MPLDRLVSVTGAAASRQLRRVLAEHGLTVAGWDVLRALASSDRLSHRELAGRLSLTPGALTPVVDALESAGELFRDRDPADRRVVRLCVTAAGRARLRSVAGRLATRAERLPQLAPEQDRIVRGYLTALLGAVEQR